MFWLGFSHCCFASITHHLHLYILVGGWALDRGSTIIGHGREKTWLQWFANNKGTDQPAHLRRLISAFVNRFFLKYHI